ncbi:hypothetical protein CRG98_039639, partial [Punica granatum]
MDIFEVLYGMSSLRLNPKKTEIYSAGLDGSTVQELLLISGLKRGSVPVKYLGVPLVTDKLSDKECRPLIEKITNRIDGWATQADSLWIAWIRAYFIIVGSFGVSMFLSLALKLLKLRNVAYPFLKHTVKDGMSTCFWFDHWNPLSPLLQLTEGARFGIPLFATVTAALSDIRWFERTSVDLRKRRLEEAIGTTRLGPGHEV